MKNTIILLLIFYSFFASCQQWHLERVNRFAKYKFEYWFKFQNEEDTSSYSFVKREGKLISTIQLFDNSCDPLMFARIKIENLDFDTTFYLITDWQGVGQLHLPEGNYSIAIDYLGYDPISFDFSLFENECFFLKAALGRAPDLRFYTIHSKRKLKEEEILSVMKCVKEHSVEYNLRCSDPKRYSIFIAY